VLLECYVEGISKPLYFSLESADSLEIEGSFVQVPVKNRVCWAFVTAKAESATAIDFQIKECISSPIKIFRKSQIELISAVAQRYMVSVFTVAACLSPPFRRFSHKILQSLLTETCAPVSYDQVNSFSTLTTAQRIAFEQILNYEKKISLLHGETASGKTEIYIHLAHHALQKNFGVLILVPEISLTPMLVDRFKKSLGTSKVFVLHSGLHQKQRLKNWFTLLYGEPVVAIGTRSAILAPVKNLQYLILDEEHDSSFKQQDTAFRYHAREIALLLADLGIKVILGSATPALETFYNASKGKFLYVEVPSYFKTFSPTLEIINTSQLPREAFATKSLTKRAVETLVETYKNGLQSVVFINRVGYCSALYCPTCEASATCPNCSVSLRVIKNKQICFCHICGFSKSLSLKCNRCGSKMLFIGSGTERIEEELEKIFPKEALFRLDKESTSSFSALTEALQKFSQEEIKILVTTQLFSKGHDFPKLSSLVIVNADLGSHIPDFRTNERMYSLLHQLIGRVGRSSLPAKVIIQTNRPNLMFFKYLKVRDFKSFAAEELKLRKQFGYPPFAQILRILSTSKISIAKAAETLEKAKNLLDHPELQVLGPAPCYHEKLKQAWRAHLIVKVKNPDVLRASLLKLEQLKKEKNLIIDLDPIDVL
jgi:primosomal protein N' (replication factor Y)